MKPTQNSNSDNDSYEELPSETVSDKDIVRWLKNSEAQEQAKQVTGNEQGWQQIQFRPAEGNKDDSESPDA